MLHVNFSHTNPMNYFMFSTLFNYILGCSGAGEGRGKEGKKEKGAHYENCKLIKK
jgi:hypothetical protein